jgi:hypothetical protein
MTDVRGEGDPAEIDGVPQDAGYISSASSEARDPIWQFQMREVLSGLI